MVIFNTLVPATSFEEKSATYKNNFSVTERHICDIQVLDIKEYLMVLTWYLVGAANPNLEYRAYASSFLHCKSIKTTRKSTQNSLTIGGCGLILRSLKGLPNSLPRTILADAC